MGRNLKPFIKWAGGKRWLLKHFDKYLPTEFNKNKVINKYYEPFLGGGAVLFWLLQNYEINNIEVNEINRDLYASYIAIKKDPELVIKQLSTYVNTYNNDRDKSSIYYEIREAFNNEQIGQAYDKNSWAKKASRLIFLNKTCFNGLFRVNLRGKYNVPFGKVMKDVVMDKDNLFAISKSLGNINITNEDYSNIENKPCDNSLIYFDPPYTTAHNNNGFIKYNAKLFAIADQEKLAQLAKRLSKRNCKIIISNADHVSIRKIFSGFKIHRIDKYSSLSANVEKRKIISELIITNIE